MFAEVTCAFCVTGVKVAVHIIAIAMSLATLGSTLEDMDTLAVDVLDGQSWLEEHINRQVLVLQEVL